MSQRNDAAQSVPTVSDERLRNALRRELHRAINVDRSTTRAQLAADSGVNIYEIDQILSRDKAKQRRVAGEVALSLALALGERAVNAVLFTIGWSGRPLDDGDAQRPMAIVANVMTHLAVIGRAAADDLIDHVEEPDATDAADMIIAELKPLSSAGKL